MIKTDSQRGLSSLSRLPRPPAGYTCSETPHHQLPYAYVTHREQVCLASLCQCTNGKNPWQKGRRRVAATRPKLTWLYAAGGACGDDPEFEKTCVCRDAQVADAIQTPQFACLFTIFLPHAKEIRASFGQSTRMAPIHTLF